MKIAFINPQGNFDNKDSHWTEHPDFGGQLVYVKEVALSLAKLGVDVDIITRKIVDEEWPEFAEDVLENYHGEKRVRIVRIPFGGDKFLNKEKLWPYLTTDFVHGIINFYKNGEETPNIITGHYGDGGFTAQVLSEKLNIPFTFTAHSLGAQKMDKLHINKDNFDQFEERFHFKERINAERLAMNKSYVNIVSTSQERFEQYSHKYYEGAVDVNDESKFRVIPPGVNTEVFDFNEKKIDIINYEGVKNYIKRDIIKSRVNLPCIVLASRLDAKKNHIAAVKAFASNKELQSKANLVITLRGIENAFADYSFLNSEEKEILDAIMKVIKENDLLGKVTMFSVNGQENLGSIYRVLSSMKSVFCLTANYEPFGLAPIEAMYAGLPAVVTKNGGPVEITDNGKYGVVVDPADIENIAKGILEALDNFQKYNKLGIQRVTEKYTWLKTAEQYLIACKEALENEK